MIGGLAHARPDLSRRHFWPFFGLMLLHCFFYVPTLSVTNAIAFANLKDAQKDFGFVRVWGTIGWIAAAGRSFSCRSPNLFTVAGIASLVPPAVLPDPAAHAAGQDAGLARFAPSRGASSSWRSPPSSCCSS